MHHAPYMAATNVLFLGGAYKEKRMIIQQKYIQKVDIHLPNIAQKRLILCLALGISEGFQR